MHVYNLIFFSTFLYKSLKMIETSDNDQPACWDTPPFCKINGDNMVYILALSRGKKQTGGLGALLSSCFKRL